MIKAKVTELEGKSIRIERIFDNGEPSIHCYPAEFKADSSNAGNTVTVIRLRSPFTAFTVRPEEIEINGKTPATVEEAVTSLNAFIGNFNSGDWHGQLAALKDGQLSAAEALAYLIDMAEQPHAFVDSPDWAEALLPAAIGSPTAANFFAFKGKLFVSSLSSSTTNTGIYVLDEETREFTRVHNAGYSYTNWTVRTNPATGKSTLYVSSSTVAYVLRYNEETGLFEQAYTSASTFQYLLEVGGRLFARGAGGIIVLDDDTGAFVEVTTSLATNHSAWWDYSGHGFLFVTGTSSSYPYAFVIDIATGEATRIDNAGYSFIRNTPAGRGNVYKGGEFFAASTTRVVRVDMETRELAIMATGFYINHFMPFEVKNEAGETVFSLLLATSTSSSAPGLYRYDEANKTFVKIHDTGYSWGIDVVTASTAADPYTCARSAYLNGYVYLSSITSGTGILRVDKDGNVTQVTSEYYYYTFLTIPGKNFLFASSMTSYVGLWRVNADGTLTKILATGYGWGMLFEHGGTPYVSSVASTYGLYRVNADGSVTSVYGSVMAAYVAYRFDNGAAVIATSARILFITATGTVTSPATFARMRRVLGLSRDGSKVYLATDAGTNGSLGILSVSQAGAVVTMYSLGRNWDKLIEVNGKRYVTTTVTGTDGILELDEETGKFNVKMSVSGDYDFHGEPFDKWIAGAYNGQLPMMDGDFRVVSYQSGYLDGDGVQYPAYTVNLHGFISAGQHQQRRVFTPAFPMLTGMARIADVDTGKNYYPTSGSVVFRAGSINT